MPDPINLTPEQALDQLKAVLPEMAKISDFMKGAVKTEAEYVEFKKKVEKLDGDLGLISKNFTEILDLEKTRKVVGDEINDEMRLDFTKFATAVFKQGRNPSSDSEAMIKTVQGKYPARYKTAMSEGTPGDGGYLIPTGFSKYIWRAALQASVALQEAQIMPLTKMFKIPLSRISTDVSVYWENEKADITAHVSNPTLTQSDLTAKKLMGWTPITNELLEDEPEGLMDEVGSTSLIDWLVNLFGEAMGQEIDNQAFNGDGTTFTGILKTTGVNSLMMNHGHGSFDDVNFTYLSKMISMLKVSQLQGAKFYLSPSILHVIRTIQDSDGRYVWQPSPGLGEPATIWGYPYRVCEKMPALTASATSTPFMFFGNMKKFVIGSKGNMTMRLATELKILEDESVLVVRRRIAMLTALPTAFVILKTSIAET